MLKKRSGTMQHLRDWELSHLKTAVCLYFFSGPAKKDYDEKRK
jgi:hypothetical protein